MEQMVRVRDGEVWADDSGGAGDGPPLVLLHPGVGDSRIRDPVLPALAERHRVIRYDVRGHGRSPEPTTPYTPSEDLRSVLDHFGVVRAVLVGTSMGGKTAITHALDDPGRVAALGLLVPGVTGHPGLKLPELTEQIGKLAQAGDMDGLVALGLRVWGAAGTAPVAAAAEQLRAAIPGWFSNYGHETEDAPAFDRLGELRLPCALLLGEQDMPEVVRCNEEMAARIPGCRLVRRPDCDHFPTLRIPDEVVRVVAELYARVA
ncbi:alpha/beta fold hydrolase [Streptomyces viridochromogenes]|uniref:Putative Alpha or beta hydrolase fold-1 n=1 Tax=Streptomyces viridochromogenes Tue57 TaxID=1160705 RepID=L8P8R2_STRVR|nr:alpha/beta hydrolase [Streptomyces viridochromogenes]ELS53981.1 putative Alpha or beta hydrolase fold-1 [Streptomyces viridochromogenes Tue57]